jgi:hypothetical protein
MSSGADSVPGSGPLLRREASSAGVGGPKKPGLWKRRRGPLDVLHKIHLFT